MSILSIGRPVFSIALSLLFSALTTSCIIKGMIGKIKNLFVANIFLLTMFAGATISLLPSQPVDAVWCIASANGAQPFFVDGTTCPESTSETTPPHRDLTLIIGCPPGAGLIPNGTLTTAYTSPGLSCSTADGGFAAEVRSATANTSGLGVVYRYTFRCNASTVAPSGTVSGDSYVVSCPVAESTGLSQPTPRQSLTAEVTLGPDTEQSDCGPGYIVSPTRTSCLLATSDTDPNNCIDAGSDDQIEQCLFPAADTPTTPGDVAQAAAGECDGAESSACSGFNVATPDPNAPILDTTPRTIVCSDPENPTDADNTILCKFIQVINFLSVGVAVVSAITVAVVGMQYMSSRGDPSKTAQAIGRLMQVGFGIVFYVFGWALLNWLIPGGAI